MGLDYWSGCVNFRDVGEWIELIWGKSPLPPRTLLRGGRIDCVASAEEVGCPRIIINLRGGPDPRAFGATIVHLPAANSLEKYQTGHRDVRAWLNRVVAAVGSVPGTPILVHCTSGKDRTGIVVAALLSILGVPREVIVEEYLLSDGEVRREWIEGALDGFGRMEEYFDRVDLAEVRRVLSLAHL